MKVLKFGGTSVATASSIKKVAAILQDTAANTKSYAVVSAFGGITDLLQEAGTLANVKDVAYKAVWEKIAKRHINTAKELNVSEDALLVLDVKLNDLKSILDGVFLINEFSPKTQDKVLGSGELLSSFVISEMLKITNPTVALKDSRALIKTDSSFTKAQLQTTVTYANIKAFDVENSASITILPGFISSNEFDEPTTLGRGGSDFTAAIIAAALDAEVLEIWTDVSGMFTAHPKLVSQAYPISQLSFHEAMELSHFGAKVLYPPSLRPVRQKGIPLLIKNTFDPTATGTFITVDGLKANGPVKGISHLDHIALLTLEGSGMVGEPGVSKRFFKSLSENGVNVVLITQASSEHSICIGLSEADVVLANVTINETFAYEISLGKLQPVIIEKGLAIVAVIGDAMKSHQGISGKMFSVLGKNNVNIRAIAQGASERNISAVIAKKDVKKAVNVLHYRFFEEQIKVLHVFIVGLGNVGSKLIAQIEQQQAYLLSHLKLQLRVAGICNSRKMAFNEEGIDLSTWQEIIKNGQDKTEQGWFDTIKELNLQNSVFVDVTANDIIAGTYGDYLKESISVVACNKIACAAGIASYRSLKSLSREFNAPFLFETNVGAGLPVINTLNNLINSGDEVTKIQAVLSGSLNFIFNNFKENTSFYEVVQQAKEEGYTEPDPRIDLSGIDVARKILILVRESGVEMEISEVNNTPFLPESSIAATSVPDFLETLKEEAPHFEALYKSAQENKCRLKYVASFEDGKASVSLAEIPVGHPFYDLEGKDNIVLFYTKRYIDQPLIIKGAGAGAAVTASGLFGDIISLKGN